MSCNKETKRCKITKEDYKNGYMLPICCRQNLMSILMALPMIMEDTHWWIDCGTLLGFYRDGRIIDCDTDVDISVLEKTFNREQFFSNCEKYGFHILEKDKTRDVIRINYSKTNLLHSDVWIWHKRDNKVIRNISTKWDSNEDKKLPQLFMTKGVISNKYISLLDSLNINGIDYPAPHDIEEYLAIFYGDWDKKVNKYEWLKKLGVME